MNKQNETVLLNRKDAANYLLIKPQTLAVWATTGRYALPYIKVGGRVAYRLADLNYFLESRTQINTK